MDNRWSDRDAAALVAKLAPVCGEDLALRTYSSRLIGAEPGLVLHGGGNTSVKGLASDVFGDSVEALFVKASGADLAVVEPGDHVAVALAPLRELRKLDALSDEAIVAELRRRLFDPFAANPSIETPVHALIPGRFVDHTHADAILALTNRRDGVEQVRRALGDELIVLPYAKPGFRLAKAVAEACEANPAARAMVWMRHGLITWADTARESYSLTIELVSRAEDLLRSDARVRLQVPAPTPGETATRRLARVAPMLRGMLARPSGNPDRPFSRVLLRSSTERALLDAIDSDRGRELAVAPPITGDHLIRTGVLPAWVDAPDYDDEARLRVQLEEVLAAYARDYEAYLARNLSRMPVGVEPFAALPKVLLMPGLGALCAGSDAHAATVALDITERTLAARVSIAAAGGVYESLSEQQLFDMEYRSLQHAKLVKRDAREFRAETALVTGAAGAIGSGICESLLAAGINLAVTDLPGRSLDSLADSLAARYPGRVLAQGLDVTDADSVAAAFDAVSCRWGGVDFVVVNAGLAHVSSLANMELEQFRRLERVNTEGALLLLRQAARHFALQRTGGDVVLVSTKNVFAPGAEFGAYSATKAAAHQLARIASQELAPAGVRVNMVAPDAVFAHGERSSGLWDEVGPGRMAARGLDASGLRDYYRDRNLLKIGVTAEHVAEGVLFFLSRRTPTTGATLPIDGGLPDSTPR